MLRSPSRIEQRSGIVAAITSASRGTQACRVHNASEHLIQCSGHGSGVSSRQLRAATKSSSGMALVAFPCSPGNGRSSPPNCGRSFRSGSLRRPREVTTAQNHSKPCAENQPSTCARFSGQYPTSQVCSLRLTISRKMIQQRLQSRQ
jgi:hypothetical protein